jgi:outer membrane protein OmpA-like peptidoglycan-associated protein
MKQLVLFMSVLLVLWITGSSYWYVCKIRGDCMAATVPAEEVTDTADAEVQTAEQALMASIDEARAFLTASDVQKGLFASSSAEGDMSGVSDEYISKLKLVIDNDTSARIEVTGHTDITGTESYNMALGLRRAEFVKSFLTDKGISAEKIVTSSKGPKEPAASNSTREGRAANRRTEIKIII